ncbi:MAG: pirin family protein [Gammaproteobacteria bacterium]|nr:pirin family protein [Gammaproteobacteria bacterium]
MSTLITAIHALGFQWPVRDPFLFCVHHDDRYPAGAASLGPAASLAGRNIGQDFGGKDGWNMYHGETVPGFPAHPHRGFETVTIVRRGLIDHSDSLGAAARFGGGDVQWLTAGRGIVHAEMFPLLDRAQPNPLELFQIWLNLPARDKMVPPHFTMLWNHNLPRAVLSAPGQPLAEVVIVAGTLGLNAAVLPSPPHSWAARPEADVAIWTLRLEPRARCVLPAAAHVSTLRNLYFFAGRDLLVDGQSQAGPACLELRGDAGLTLEAGELACELLLLQGRPIGEPVARYGPFVMNSPAEINQAITDYRRTQFGGWPWPEPGPVHGATARRFARHADGRVEEYPA